MFFKLITVLWLLIGADCEKGISSEEALKELRLKDIKATKLDLSHQGITDLGGGLLDEFNNTKDLDLSNNNIRRIGNSTSKISKSKLLRLLDLSNNKIDSIADDSFASVPNLNELNLNGNALKKVASKYFTSMYQLEKLLLKKNAIEFIEVNSFLDLSNLNELDLSDNSIINFNESFGGLEELNVLNLNANRLTKITSDYFTGLNELQKLLLSENAIESIQEECFRNLPKLSELDLSKNLITLIKREMFLGLTNLMKLDLSNNPIVEIDASIFDVGLLNNIEEVDLRENSMNKTMLDDFLEKSPDTVSIRINQ